MSRPHNSTSTKWLNRLLQRWFISLYPPNSSGLRKKAVRVSFNRNLDLSLSLSLVTLYSRLAFKLVLKRCGHDINICWWPVCLWMAYECSWNMVSISLVSELISCAHGHERKEVRFVRYSANYQHISGFILVNFIFIFHTKKGRLLTPFAKGNNLYHKLTYLLYSNKLTYVNIKLK